MIAMMHEQQHTAAITTISIPHQGNGQGPQGIELLVACEYCDGSGHAQEQLPS